MSDGRRASVHSIIIFVEKAKIENLEMRMKNLKQIGKQKKLRGENAAVVVRHAGCANVTLCCSYATVLC